MMLYTCTCKDFGEKEYNLVYRYVYNKKLKKAQYIYQKIFEFGIILLLGLIIFIFSSGKGKEIEKEEGLSDIVFSSIQKKGIEETGGLEDIIENIESIQADLEEISNFFTFSGYVPIDKHLALRYIQVDKNIITYSDVKEKIWQEILEKIKKDIDFIQQWFETILDEGRSSNSQINAQVKKVGGPYSLEGKNRYVELIQALQNSSLDKKSLKQINQKISFQKKHIALIKFFCDKGMWSEDNIVLLQNLVALLGQNLKNAISENFPPLWTNDINDGLNRAITQMKSPNLKKFSQESLSLFSFFSKKKEDQIDQIIKIVLEIEKDKLGKGV